MSGEGKYRGANLTPICQRPDTCVNDAAPSVGMVLRQCHGQQGRRSIRPRVNLTPVTRQVRGGEKHSGILDRQCAREAAFRYNGGCPGTRGRGPIVYRLGRGPFKAERRVRLPLGPPLCCAAPRTPWAPARRMPYGLLLGDPLDDSHPAWAPRPDPTNIKQAGDPHRACDRRNRVDTWQIHSQSKGHQQRAEAVDHQHGDPALPPGRDPHRQQPEMGTKQTRPRRSTGPTPGRGRPRRRPGRRRRW